jgi:predicted alpha/beta-hydrolase family hydrolase
VIRRWQVEWSPGRTVPLVTEGGGATAVVLAHGAGAGQSHPFMVGMRERLAASFSVTTFDYPYIAAGRRAPDRMETLLECHHAVAAAVATDADRMVFGGKSMGGRVGSHLEAPEPAARFFLGYPLVAIGKSEPRDTSHLDRIATPLLFVQGERDRLGPPDLLAPVVARLANASIVVIEEADHSFNVPKKAGVSPEQMLDRLAELVTQWLAGG